MRSSSSRAADGRGSPKATAGCGIVPHVFAAFPPNPCMNTIAVWLPSALTLIRRGFAVATPLGYLGTRYVPASLSCTPSSVLRSE